MKLTGDESTKFEMKVVGYQFPHLGREPYDADWLNITVNVTHPRGSWYKTDACLLTFELDHLIGCLESIAENRPASFEENFTEPELSFEWFGKGLNILRVYLSYGLRPEWSPYCGRNEEEELYVEFVVSPEDLRRAAVTLRDDLKKFPVRVPI